MRETICELTLGSRVREGAVAEASSLQDKISPKDSTFAKYSTRFGLNRGN